MRETRLPALVLLLGSAAALRMPTTAPNTAAGALHARRRLRLSPRMQDYDLGRKEFDLLELQSFRRETILQYSLINRTEQLRILLLALSALISAFAPTIAAELFPREGAADTGVASLGISAVSALGFGALAYREKVARGQKLRRLEREFSIGELSATQPASPLAARLTLTLTLTLTPTLTLTLTPTLTLALTPGRAHGAACRAAGQAARRGRCRALGGAGRVCDGGRRLPPAAGAERRDHGGGAHGQRAGRRRVRG